MVVDVGSRGFHEVKREGVAGAVVDVPDPDARVETDGETGDPGFGFEDRVEVVEDRVDGCDGDTRAVGERAVTGADLTPVIGYPVEVPLANLSRIPAQQAQ